MVYHAIPPTKQQSYLDTFSPNTSENKNQVFRFLNSVPNGTIIRNGVEYPDLTKGMVYTNAVGGGTNNLTIRDISSNLVTINPGICTIGGVNLEITKEYTVDVLDALYYLFSPNDTVPTSDGQYYLYLTIYYNPTQLEPNSYFSLINDKTYYENNKQYLILLDVLDISIVGGVIQGNIEILTSDPTNTLITIRPMPSNIVDGGVIGNSIDPNAMVF